MNEFNLTNTLLATQNIDTQQRIKAENYLKELQEKNFAKYVDLLCDELVDENKPIQSSNLAGILLKNTIDAKNIELKKSLQTRWLSIPINQRNILKQKIMKIKCSSKPQIRNVAALVISRIVMAEKGTQEGFELLEAVFNIAANGTQNARSSSLRSIGFLCEECPDEMAVKSDPILELLCKSCESPSSEIQFEAAKALFHAIYFANDIFCDDKKRNYVTTIIFNLIKSPHNETKAISIDCLTRIAEIYYEHLHSIISTVLKLTSHLLNDHSADLSIKLRITEFWSTLAEVEEEITSYDAADRPTPLRNYIRSSLSGLVPLLLHSMTLQTEENFEDDVNNEASIAATCLHLVALCAKDDLVAVVKPFLAQNFSSADWHLKEASICALGLILDGPAKESLGPLVSAHFETLLGFCEAESPFIRDTATWTISKVCKRFSDNLYQYEALFRALVRALQDRAKIAANACLAVYNLAENLESGQEFNKMTHMFDHLAEAIVKCSDRQDNNLNNLLSCCYETLNCMILTSAKQSLPTIIKMAEIFSTKLNITLSPASLNNFDNEFQVRRNNLQAMLIGSLSSIIKILPAEKVNQLAENAMVMFIKVLQSNDKTIFEEVLMAVGVIALKIGQNFEKFVNSTKSFVMTGLNGNLGSSVCHSTVGLVGDIARGLGKKLIDFNVCDEFVAALLKTLHDNKIDRNSKPAIISCLGDIALSINEKFERYFEYTMNSFQIFCTLNITNPDYSDIDFQNELRQSLFESFSMIIHSVASTNCLEKMSIFFESIIILAGIVGEDKETDSAVLSSALAFFGDSLETMGAKAKTFLDNSQVNRLVELGRQSKNIKVKESLDWLTRMVMVATAS